MIQRIAVMGAGSLGTILGAYLSKAGRDVVLIDAYQRIRGNALVASQYCG